MEKSYNRVKAMAFFEIESIIYLAHCRSSQLIEERPRQFDFWQMYYCACGLLCLNIDGVVTKVPQHHAVLLAPGENKRFVLQPPDGGEGEFYVFSFETTSYGLMHFKNQTIQLYGDETRLLEDICKIGSKVLEPIKTNQSMQGLCEKAKTHPVVLQYVKILLEQFFIKLYCRLNQIESLPNEAEKANSRNYEKNIVAVAQNFMESHIEQKLTIRAIAEALGVNATSLRIAYKKETGKRLIRSFGDMKITEAKRLICSSSLNFTQIADRLGFLSLYHFSRFFKEREGITLSDYSRFIEKRP